MTQTERLNFLISYLLHEDPQYAAIEIPRDTENKKRLLRSLMNVRMPQKTSAEFLEVQDEYLKEETRLKGITDAADLVPVCGKLCLWQGDITTLKCGAIVNAANSAMLGCFVPCHGCIDNAIHTFAGVQLRAECEAQMRGGSEKTGTARITRAYNLPCDYVIHTVGPIIRGKLTASDCTLLSSCYRASLKAADEKGVKSIAFCCISTGEFHFPNEKAASIAIETVTEYLPQTKIERVIFNVFKDTDLKIYKRLLTID